MKILSLGRKGISLGLSFVLTMAVIALCFVSTGTEARAATKNVASFSELKTAVANASSGDTIHITKTFAATETITINESITLTCYHDSGAKNQDIYRHQDFHGSIFVVDNDATLTLRCCVSGNGKEHDDDTNFRGYGFSNKEADGYYGAVLIRLKDGNLVMDSDKSILKNNYNPGTQGEAKWTYNGITYYADAKDTYDTSDTRTGSAVYGYHGSFTMSAGRIYNCVSDNGPALYFASGYSGDQAKISGGLIYNNVARRFGGAIFSINRENNVFTKNTVAEEDFHFSSTRTLNSSCSNARLTISDSIKIYNNISKLGGGGIWSGHGATLYMTGGEIYGNVSTESSGGGIRTNAGDPSAISSTSSVCMGLPGGQTKITGGEIYENSAVGDGGGIQAARIDYDVAESECKDTSIYTDNKFTMTGGTIYNNSATGDGGGIVTATQTYISGGRIGSGTSSSRGNTAGGDGGGIYCNAKSHLEMTGGYVSYNTATGDGGGIYLVSGGGASKIVDAEIYKNAAVNGGGVASNRSKGLTVGGSTKVYSNTASNDGGGLYTKGICTINKGYFYANNPSGVHAASGTLNVKGGKYGFSSYSNGSTYEVSRNTYAQMVIGSSAECELTDSDSPRFITSYASGETISDNFGIRNHGTVTTGTDGKIIFFGTGTSVYNNGDFDVKCSFNIQSSEKAGATTHQRRLGIHNTSNGTFEAENSDFEVKYCGNRGIYNQGEFILIDGNIHDNTVPSTTTNADDNKGAGVCNYGSNAEFSLEGGTITNNEAYYGGGVYNASSGTFTMIGGTISDNTAARGAGVYNTKSGVAEKSAGMIENNTASVSGGGIHNNGTFKISDGTIQNNNGAEYGGGVYSDVDAKTTISGGVIRENIAQNGAGVANVGSLTISDGSIYGHSSDYGAGVFNGVSGTTTIEGGEIFNNTATIGGGLTVLEGGTGIISGGRIYDNTATNGGGVYNYGSLEMYSGGIISTNTSAECGGGVVNAGGFSMYGGRIHTNSAPEHGGGVYITEQASTIIYDGNIYLNDAKFGGGVSNNGSVAITGGAIGGTKADGVSIAPNTASEDGGGVWNAGTLQVTGGAISNNTTRRYGGGIYNKGAAILSGGTITANTAHYINGNMIQGAGGGVYSISDLTLNGIAIKSNTATTGGGVCVETPDNATEAVTLTIDGSEITENIANDGAGVYGYACTIDMKSGSVSNNHAGKIGDKLSTGTGGGIGIAGDGEKGLLKLSGGKINNNTVVGDLDGSISGGGVYCHKATIEMTGGEISGNSSVYNGGGVYLEERAHLDMTGGTISNNTAGKRGGGVCLIYYWDSVADIGGNAVITGNTAGTEATEGLGGGIYNGGCVGVYVKDNASINKNKAAYGGGIFNDDYGVLEITGGTVGGSVVEDGNVVSIGNEAVCGGGVYTYGEGAVFTMSGGSVACNNATEDGGGVYLDETTVNNTISGGEIFGNNGTQYGGGIYWAGAADLTACEIYQNHAASGGGIYFVPVDTTTELKIVDGVNIYENTAFTGGGVYLENGYLNMTGGKVNSNTAEEDGGGIHIPSNGQKCYISGGEISGNSAVRGAGVNTLRLNGLEISGGKISGNTATKDGGGVYCHTDNGITDDSAKLTVSDKAEIFGNKAAGGAGIFSYGTLTVTGGKINDNTATGQGGGINVWEFTAEINDAELKGNSAQLGGGVFNNASVVIDNCTIDGNIASESGGGVLASNTATTTEIIGCTISNNKADFGAGVFDHSRSDKDQGLRVKGCVITKNNATTDGGGVYVSHAAKAVADSVALIDNSEIYSNSATNSGGGVYNYGRIEFTGGTKIYSNTAENGGGLYIPNQNNDIDTALTSVAFYKNEATYGGAIANVCTYKPLNIIGDKVLIYENTAKTYGGGVYNTGTVNVSDVVINNNTAGSGGAIFNARNLNVTDSIIRNNTAKSYGGGIADWGANASMEVVDSKIFENSAYEGGGVYAYTVGKDDKITDCEIYDNTASYGGGVSNNRAAGLTVTNTKIYNNTAKTNGGGIYNSGIGDNNGVLTVESGYIYNNTKGGVYVNKGTGTINGGYYGFSDYTDDTDYEVSRNTVAQIITVSGGTCTVTGKNKTRIISTLADGETIDKNIGIKNGGTFTVDKDCKDFDVYGTGTGVSNTGTFTVDGAMRITTSEKAGSQTMQNRLGILNGAAGTVNLNSDDIEISYCDTRGINNQGALYIAGGEVHHCISSESGAGIFNEGTNAQLNMSGGKVYDNTVAMSGGGVYLGRDVKTSEITGGEIYNNTVISTTKNTGLGGGIFTATTNGLTVSSENVKIHDNTSELGGGIYSGVNITINNGVEIYNNKALLRVDQTLFDKGYTGGNGGGLYIIYSKDAENTVELSGANIHNNYADYQGGGVYNPNGLNISGSSKIYENEAWQGGGLYNRGTATVTNNVEIYNNSVAKHTDFTSVLKSPAVGGGIANNEYGNLTINGNVLIYTNECAENTGGGIYNANYCTLDITGGVEIYENEAMSGGGIYNAGEFNLSDNVQIYENNATQGGGGITTQTKPLVMRGGEVCNNTSPEGAGIYFGTGCKTNQLLGGSIHDNTATGAGGGIRLGNKTVGVTIDNGFEIYNNTAANGGGAYVTLGTLDVKNGKIYGNLSSSSGGGIWSSGVATMVSGEVYKNTGKYGGGVFNSGTFNLDGGEISGNTSEKDGGGVRNFGTFNMSGGFIENNAAGTTGNGVFINPGAIFSMTGGKVSANTNNSHKQGVYVSAPNTSGVPATFNMSEDAVVTGDNIVYLAKGAYISVPNEFNLTEQGNDIRAYIEGADMVTGRVVSKHVPELVQRVDSDGNPVVDDEGNPVYEDVDALGTVALYHDASAPVMTEQYFAVNGKLLRAGNQGAADVTDAINDEDVYLTEKYTIDFDMNPPTSMLLSSAKHTIGEGEDAIEKTFTVLTGWVNEGVYQKYWNEKVSFNPGHASSDASVFDGWYLKDDVDVKFTPDEVATIAADVNKTIVIMADWLSVIDIDYDGNGATEGEGWTEEKVDITEDYDTSDDNDAFSRQEEGEDGQMRLFSFMGWSLNSEDVAKKYGFGDPDAFEADITADSRILINAAKPQEGRTRDVATIYAVWDEYPTIDAVDRWFTLDEAQAGKITLDELMSTAFACDGYGKDGKPIETVDEDGKIVNLWEGDNTKFFEIKDGKLVRTNEGEFTIVDFGATDFTSFKSSGKVTITYKAVDKVGNTTLLDVDVYIIDKDQQIGDVSELFTRFISGRYFKDAEGNFVPEANGGLSSESKWVKDADHTEALEKALGNTKNEETGEWDFVYETWTFDIEEIQKVKAYIETHGLGNSKENDALRQFYSTFK